MPLLVSDAIILHVADYLESSRILRLATREAGVQAVVARGARNSRKRFGSAVDLFALGEAQIEVRSGRDLHTLVSFDVTGSQPQLAADLARFSAASALAECALRVVHDESAPVVYDGLLAAFTAIGASTHDQAVSTALGALWRLVRDVGFAPSMDMCAECHATLDREIDVAFSHHAGGALCARCAARSPSGRRLPASARQAISSWMEGTDVELIHTEARAHQRLFREFVSHHVTDGRPMRAFAEWESGLLDVARS